jgi:uncharacterized membrane protein YeiH
VVDQANLFRLVSFFHVLAAIVFAVSGALVASCQRLEVMAFVWFAVITGVGGGTVRDPILGVPVFWVRNPVHVSTGSASGRLTAMIAGFLATFIVRALAIRRGYRCRPSAIRRSASGGRAVPTTRLDASRQSPPLTWRLTAATDRTSGQGVRAALSAARSAATRHRP